MKKNFTLPLLLATFLFIEPDTMNAQVDVNDSLALVDLYNSTDGPHWLHNNGWLTTQPVETWDGISVAQNRVAIISLNYWNLKGNIPVSFGNLTNLTTLNLGSNELSGTIPSSFGKLVNLQYLVLNANQLSGIIPSSLGNLINLETLYLNYNKLHGTIPPEFGNLTKLKYLILNYNKLSGDIPPQLGNLTNLDFLTLNNNKLSGSIPSELGKLVILSELNLSNNQLSGSIPTELGNINDLSELALNNNQLSGSIPTELSNISVYRLKLNNNQLSGNIPAELGNIAKLNWLDLSNNQLTGSIPSELGKPANLTYVYLNNNQLSGSIPASLGNSKRLFCLYLDHNQLSGRIPRSFGNLKRILYLNLANNQLSGTVPIELLNISTLRNAYIQENHFTFDGIELLVQNYFDELNYSPQEKLHIHKINNTLSVYAGGTLSNNTYKWFKGGVLAATIVGESSYTPTISGAYTVRVTNSIAGELTLHSDTATFTKLTASNQNNIAASKAGDKNNFSIYPNPAKTTTTIALNATGNCVIKIADVSGRVIQTKTIAAVKGRNTLQLDVSKYAAGVYFVTMSNEKNETQTLRFSKE